MKACYIHVPFCKDICSYCDFTRCRYHVGLANLWLTTITKEIHVVLKDSALETIYIGGGTPSALSDEQLEKLLIQLQPYTTKQKEFTIEANIDSLTNDKLRIMKQYGINRISLGVQTLQPNLLDCIQRTSTKEDALDAIQRIHQHGIHNISIDLIYGLPTQTLAQWKQDLYDIVTNFDIEHISLYALTIEKNSRFGREQIEKASETIEADMYEYAIQFLKAHGFEHYEISNFAKNKKRSLHNQMYWLYEDFAGIGCGASGKLAHMRYDNTHNLQTYFEQGPSPECTVLSKEDEMFETIMMGLRMKDGICIQGFYERFSCHINDIYALALQKNIDRGWLVEEDGYIKTTYQGMLLLNDVLVDFLS